MKVNRLGPIITPDTDPSIGRNINGPSVIRCPRWLENPLGVYYLYFGHHQGQHIRMAYADQLSGPWHVRGSGTLDLAETPCHHHIASPDVILDHARHQIIMYYHGPVLSDEAIKNDPLTARYPMLGGQRTLCATSADGIHFESGSDILGSSYMRVFPWRGMTYGLAMPGLFYRSRDGFQDFEEGPTLFDDNMRHAGVTIDGDSLAVYFTNSGDCPERIMRTRIELVDDWTAWQETPPETVLCPDADYEGGLLDLTPSRRGAVHGPCRQLRDPFVFPDDGGTYLFYAIAGESGIALAEITCE